MQIVERLVAGAIGLFTQWFVPFCHDFIFYGAFSLVIMAVFRSIDPEDSNWRILYLCVGVWLWAWFLITVYSCLHFNSFITRHYLITQGDIIREMRDKYLLPPSLREPLTFTDMIFNVVRNQCVYFGVAMLLWNRCKLFSGLLEPWWRVLINIAILMISFDILLYAMHYTLHVFLWPFHRDHHRTKATTPVSGWYMHIIDLMMELWIPIFLPAFFFNMGWLTMATWLTLVEWDGVHTHAGFVFWPGVIPGPQRHWLHHMLFFCNYSIGLGDYCFGTEAPQKEYDAYAPMASEPPASPRLVADAPVFPFAPSLQVLLSTVSVNSDPTHILCNFSNDKDTFMSNHIFV
eukprot:GEMP01053378.1.p1 GENE.GEMP01053378.1~~GEMP01053378.1.p1  ORF type:complete len:346 (+),score=28.82 GEMP01053378.1:190-1227(+)